MESRLEPKLTLSSFCDASFFLVPSIMFQFLGSLRSPVLRLGSHKFLATPLGCCFHIYTQCLLTCIEAVTLAVVNSWDTLNGYRRVIDSHSYLVFIWHRYEIHKLCLQCVYIIVNEWM